MEREKDLEGEWGREERKKKEGRGGEKEEIPDAAPTESISPYILEYWQLCKALLRTLWKYWSSISYLILDALIKW